MMVRAKFSGVVGLPEYASSRVSFVFSLVLRVMSGSSGCRYLSCPRVS